MLCVKYLKTGFYMPGKKGPVYLWTDYSIIVLSFFDVAAEHSYYIGISTVLYFFLIVILTYAYRKKKEKKTGIDIVIYYNIGKIMF